MTNPERSSGVPHFRGTPKPLGVRAAVVKMALIEADTAKGAPLTEDERKMITAVGMFLGGEYDRIASDNDRLSAELLDARDKLARIARIVSGATG